MTKEEVLAMEAGRELDSLVAREILCLDVEERQDFLRFYVRDTRTPILNYSTDISAAWQAVEKIDLLMNLDYDPISKLGRVRFQKPAQLPIEWITVEGNVPEAICKAALLARLGAAK